jgi:hypothetical protein
MKTCPACHKTYEDESLVFCLDDGARLERERSGPDPNATWNLPPPGPTVASPRPTSPAAPATLTAQPEMLKRPVNADHGRSESKSSALPWIFAIVLVLGASGVLIAWLMTSRGAGDTSSLRATPTPLRESRDGLATPSPNATMEKVSTPTPIEQPSPTPKRSEKETNQQATPTPVKERPKPMFTILDNMTFQGSRITYYQRTSFALCKSDCAGNANCRGATWIRPGAYNPNDPGMCYLMSALTQRVPHVCCISAVKN